MKWWFASVALLCLLACRDPNSYQPFDPTKPDPPPPPVLISPASGWVSSDFAYPQDVDLRWQAVPGAQFYQIEVYRDSLLRSDYLMYSNPRAALTSLTATLPYYGLYFWRVRASSRNWNNYTGWSSPFHFALPNPAR
jgi:hypothetical protein